MNILKNREYLRSILFGIEDSLISTTGLIAGISIGSENKSLVLLTGFIAVVIEAVSMGAGEYLSDETVEELEKLKRHRENPMLSGTLMVASYFVAGMVPLAPVMLFSFPTSVILSVLLSFIALFLIGYIKGKVVKVKPIRSGLKILFIGGVATLLGLLVGLVFQL